MKGFVLALSGQRVFLALLGICAVFSLLTIQRTAPEGNGAGEQVAREFLSGKRAPQSRVLVVSTNSTEDGLFAVRVAELLGEQGIQIDFARSPIEAREAAEGKAGIPLSAILASGAASSWPVLERFHIPVLSPVPSAWPVFLQKSNLLNIASQISVIAIIAAGMTLVIMTGGIDLSVGSIAALSAVVSTRLVRDCFGGVEASMPGMLVAGGGAIFVGALVGWGSGAIITWCGVPPFLATMGVMLVASGLAFQVSEGQSVYQVPDGFTWLGRESVGGVPVVVILMLGLYALTGHVVGSTVLGRYILATGSNPVAAYLAGVPVKRVQRIVYATSGALAALGGVILASQLKSGAPTYGQMYELYVIAAVVVGGTSLSGGQGSVWGTLVGALLIAVIQNGMNLLGMESYTQKIVLGLVLLAAVLADRMRRT
jgi:ribose transport system permease protein